MSYVCEKHNIKLLTYGTLVGHLFVLMHHDVNVFYNSAEGSWRTDGLMNPSQIRIPTISLRHSER
jgi:hypothetical protein